MHTKHQFPNLFNSQEGFSYFTDSMTLWDQRYHSNGWVLSAHAAWYQTYGDGNIQHSHDVICGVRHFFEWTASFADYLLKHPEVELPSYPLGLPTVNREQVEFLLSVKFREDKRQWYNPGDRKVSASESKRHDKRWIEVPRWADGTIDSAFALNHYVPDAGGRRNEFLDAFYELRKFKEFGEAFTGYQTSKVEREYEDEIRRETKMAHSWFYGFDALINIVESMERIAWAKRCVERCRENLEAARAESRIEDATNGTAIVHPNADVHCAVKQAELVNT